MDRCNHNSFGGSGRTGRVSGGGTGRGEDLSLPRRSEGTEPSLRSQKRGSSKRSVGDRQDGAPPRRAREARRYEELDYRTVNAIRAVLGKGPVPNTEEGNKKPYAATALRVALSVRDRQAMNPKYGTPW